MTTLYIEQPLATQGLLNMIASLAGVVIKLHGEGLSHINTFKLGLFLYYIINDWPGVQEQAYKVRGKPHLLTSLSISKTDSSVQKHINYLPITRKVEE